MANSSDLARQHTAFGSPERAHLRRLIGSWGPLADLSFSDLTLFARTKTATQGAELVVLGQIRPATAQTLYVDDQIGRLVPLEERPLVALAFESGEIQEKEMDLRSLGRRVRITAIPVRFGAEVIAVVSRESRQLENRIPSELEFTYLDVFERLSRMMMDGTFPFPFEDAVTEESAR